MTVRSIRHRLNESTNLWPGFVDVLATLLIVIIFVLMVFTVSQIYLSDAISGRDKALENLRNQINELSKILIIETKEKETALKEYNNFSSKVLIPIRKLGSASLDMAYVAAGRCDGFWQRNLNYWDIAAGIILVIEAGGFVTDFHGNNKHIQDKSILVTNAKINKEMIEILSG